MSEQGWTRKQFIAALKKAGWKRLDTRPAFVFQSPAGLVLHIDSARDYLGGTVWAYFAARRELPPPDFPPF